MTFYINKNFKSAGFTVIELLVVVAIIGLMASLSLVYLRDVRARSRDTRRVADIYSLATALHLYNNTFSSYPIYTGDINGGDNMSVALTRENILRSIAVDPLNITVAGVDYKYNYSSDGETFTIQYCLETDYIHNKDVGCDNYIRP
jgi:prepilin-type N-terminal cleavage/methylation domain-containing protein